MQTAIIQLAHADAKDVQEAIHQLFLRKDFFPATRALKNTDLGAGIELTHQRRTGIRLGVDSRKTHDHALLIGLQRAREKHQAQAKSLK